MIQNLLTLTVSTIFHTQKTETQPINGKITWTVLAAPVMCKVEMFKLATKIRLRKQTACLKCQEEHSKLKTWHL